MLFLKKSLKTEFYIFNIVHNMARINASWISERLGGLLMKKETHKKKSQSA